MPDRIVWPFALILGLLISGCTVHPRGEAELRREAIDAGSSLSTPPSQRTIAPLAADPTPEQLVTYALLNNAALEQAWWQWRAAIEQIPQDGTQAGNLALSGNLGLSRGSLSLDRTVLGVGNDPMADLVLPSKLSAAARRALENARAAGWRFRQAKNDLRARVLVAYDDYALTAELIRLEQSNIDLLSAMATVAEARAAAGGAQLDPLKARNELDLARNTLAHLQSQLPIERAKINALLNRPGDSALTIPRRLPPPRPLSHSDRQILARAAQTNPRLGELARLAAAGAEDVTLAKLQRDPDFSVALSSDLAGIAQSLAGMVTIPILRHQAIDAAIEQARDNLHATQASSRQKRADLGAQVIGDLARAHDADRQLQLINQVILPRARQIVVLSRASYEAAQSSLLDWLEAQKSLIALQKLAAELSIARENELAELEAIVGGGGK